MKLNKTVKILVGLATLWLVLYPLLFLAVWLLMFSSMFLGATAMANASSTEFPIFMLPFFAIFPLHLLTILLLFVLMAFYLIHVIKNSKAADTVKIILGIGCFFMPFIAMPVYYYIYIWLEAPPAWALQVQAEKNA